MKWRETVFDGYFVSDLGEVRGPSGKILSKQKNNRGYVTVCVKNRQKLVHRLVATAFIENKKMLPQVNHIDGNKENNKCDNLEWCDQKHNTTHAINVLKRKIGNFTKGNYDSKGIKKYNEENQRAVICLNTKEKYASIREAARTKNIRPECIVRCAKGSQKQTSGLKWAYVCLMLFLSACGGREAIITGVSCIDMTTYVNNGKTAAMVISKERICEQERLKSVK